MEMFTVLRNLKINLIMDQFVKRVLVCTYRNEMKLPSNFHFLRNNIQYKNLHFVIILLDIEKEILKLCMNL